MIYTIDLLDSFLEFFNDLEFKNGETYAEGWFDTYLARYPELKGRCVNDIKSYGLDWKEVAAKRIFPEISKKLDVLPVARDNLIKAHKELEGDYMELFKRDHHDRINVVMYIGIGNGAGWVTYYNEYPAILYGLDQIVKLGWERYEAIAGLVSHELCHVGHELLRGKENGIIRISESPMDPGDYLLWRLYEEGFAQKCEQLLRGVQTYHQQTDDGEWLQWCDANRQLLACEYLRYYREKLPPYDFFGDWQQIMGRSQTGYYLGCSFVSELISRNMTIGEIALLDIDTAKKEALDFLKNLCE